MQSHFLQQPCVNRKHIYFTFVLDASNAVPGCADETASVQLIPAVTDPTPVQSIPTNIVLEGIQISFQFKSERWPYFSLPYYLPILKIEFEYWTACYVS